MGASAAVSSIVGRHLIASDGDVCRPRKRWQRPTLSVADSPLTLHQLGAPCLSQWHSAKVAAGRRGHLGELQHRSAVQFLSKAPQALLGSRFVPPASPSICQNLLVRLDARKAARSGSKVVAQTTATGATPDADGWIRYQGNVSKGPQAAWLPIAIGVATGVYVYPKILPYMLMLLDNILQHWPPHYLGITAVDALLGILVPFFQDVFASADYGRIIVAYFSAVILSWALAAGIESSRLDAHRSKLIKFFSPLVSVEIFSGVGVLTPLLWVAPFLRMPGNTDSAAQLTPAVVANKLVSAQRVRLLSLVILASFVPYVAGYFLTSTRYHVNQLLVALPPLVWPLLWGSTGTTDADSPVAGHSAAERLHSLAVGVGLLQHAMCVAQLVERPDMLARAAGLLHNHPMHMRPTLFVLVTTTSLWAALLSIPLAQEGPKAALGVVGKSILLGPAAAMSLYFAARERAYLDVALRANPVL
ncbi:hypothetical protein KFL_001180130 [Klebsormidium nitens]|uniref:Uncharacterized protein n=1 Tax=Klebsormidium nitens TaxID=105231 RepID=A0A1Y1HVH7_KLENI|nr:hypothetical protein KFL_001180130 [Klebsormidium nitens]|eukprot:GAQ82634.1 hypothetical protein KFL_001180130 [Klebsormidium nitens]